ncbi:MAG: oligosaccharide flippase family protein [Halieaceae bacterium]|nr:oligosaccharide flippase family protein [Halieaceae bacterium]
MAADGLRGRALRAAFIVLGERFSQQLLRLLSNLVLTRLLVPEMFGVMAIANTLVVGTQMLTDAGLQAKLIQSEHVDDERFVNTVWTISIIRGPLVSLVLLLATAGIAAAAAAGYFSAGSVYTHDELPLILATLSFLPLIDSLMSTRLALAQRRLQMGAIVRIRLISQMLGIVVMITIAATTGSIWSLVLGSLVSSVANVVQSHVSLEGPRNRLLLDRSYAADVFAFSRWIILSSSISFLANNADRLILGALLLPSVMGPYAIAVFLIEAIRQVVAALANKIALPVFSEVARTAPERLRAVFYRTRRPFDLLTGFCAGGLLASGDVIIGLLYDERYQLAGRFLQLLGVGLVMVRYQLAGQLFLAMGRARIMSIAPACRALALFAAIPWAHGSFGAEGAVAAVTLACFAELPAFLWLLARYRILNPMLELAWLPSIAVGYGVGLLCNEVLRWLLVLLGAAQ